MRFVMQVKLLQARATDRGPQQIGQVITVSDEEAKRMLQRGQCEEVKEQKGNAQRQ